MKYLFLTLLLASACSTQKSDQSFRTYLIKGVERSSNTFRITPDQLDKKDKEFKTIMLQARAIPVTNADGTMHLHLNEIAPKSIFSAFGIRNGDLVTKLDGTPIKSMEQILKFSDKLKNAQRASIDLLRKGKPLQYTYLFVR